MKKIFNKIAYVLIIFLAGALGGMATLTIMNHTNLKSKQLCKAESVNECLLAGEDASDCIMESNKVCN